MISVKIKFPRKADLVAKVKKTFDETTVKDVQREVIEGAIKPLIASGQSPVESVEGTSARRFRKYKDVKKYPAKKKANRPVNLKLSGDMLRAYTAEYVSGVRIRLGISKSASVEVKARAEANNIGTVTKDGKEAIPARRFVPLKGETYKISVMRRIKALVARRIKFLVSTKR